MSTSQSIRKITTLYRSLRSSENGKAHKKDSASEQVEQVAQIEVSCPYCPKNLQQWSSESILRAIEAVKKGEMGQNKAALEYGVPRTTLKDRHSGRVVHGTNIGPKPYLTNE